MVLWQRKPTCLIPRVLLIQWPTHVCCLQNEIYGWKQAHRAWYNEFSSHLLSLGFKASTIDLCLFIFYVVCIVNYLIVCWMTSLWLVIVILCNNLHINFLLLVHFDHFTPSRSCIVVFVVCVSGWHDSRDGWLSIMIVFYFRRFWSWYGWLWSIFEDFKVVRILSILFLRNIIFGLETPLVRMFGWFLSS